MCYDDPMFIRNVTLSATAGFSVAMGGVALSQGAWWFGVFWLLVGFLIFMFLLDLIMRRSRVTLYKILHPKSIGFRILYGAWGGFNLALGVHQIRSPHYGNWDIALTFAIAIYVIVLGALPPQNPLSRKSSPPEKYDMLAKH